jgi:hypothetical protein
MNKHYGLRYINPLILYAIRKNCRLSGSSLLLYQSTRRSIKLDCINHRGISLLSTSYKILSNILLSRLSTYTDVIIGYHQCGFPHNRSTTDQHSFSILQIPNKKWDYNETVYQLFVDFSRKPMIQLRGTYSTIFSYRLGYP